jgi:hypothetical protein
LLGQLFQGGAERFGANGHVILKVAGLLAPVSLVPRLIGMADYHQHLTRSRVRFAISVAREFQQERSVVAAVRQMEYAILTWHHLTGRGAMNDGRFPGRPRPAALLPVGSALFEQIPLNEE